MSINVQQLTDLLQRAAKLSSPLAKECGHAAAELRQGRLDLVFINPESKERVYWPVSDLVECGTPVDADSGDDFALWIEDEDEGR